MAEKCVIGYKQAFAEGSIGVYGYIFDTIEPCCDKFKRMFFDTGHQKGSNFGNHIEERDGLNLLTRGNRLTLFLRISRSLGSLFEEKIDACPFCSAEIEVKCTKSVSLIPVKEEVFKCFREVVLSPKSDKLPAKDEEDGA